MTLAHEPELSLLVRMRQRNLELDRLMRLQFLAETTIDAFVGDALRTAARLLEIPRVSVWLFNDDRTAIHCHSLFLADEDDLQSGSVLEQAQYPSYFRALHQARVIDAHDARSDQRTREFRTDYLEPLDIYSMLDAQIPSATGLKGVVCCESVGQERHWTPDESSFVASLAELVGLAFEREERTAMLARTAEALEEARRANQARAAFLANISHEIRTPLNGILGMAQALSLTDLGSEQKEQASIILDSGVSLMTVVNDILDITKIDAGKVEICPVNADLSEVLERVCKLFRPRAEEQGLKIELDIAPELQGVFRFDPVRVRQCLNNLLSNAIKFTTVGGISLHAAIRSDGEGRSQAVVTVRDSGIGIALDAQDELFNAFSQIDTSLSRNHGGTGLGLSITRRLARLMGGDVTLESAPAEGAAFTLTFDVQAMTVSQGQHKPPSAVGEGPRLKVRGKRMLLVDDNAINRRIVSTILKPMDVETRDVGSGAEALAILETEPFDLVILDIHMPGMDGMQVFRSLRRSEGPNATTPVIALTADAMSDVREKFLREGMDGYTSKPIVIADFYSEILRVLDVRQMADTRAG